MEERGGACGVTRWEGMRLFRARDGSVYEAWFSGRVAVRRIPSERALRHA